MGPAELTAAAFTMTGLRAEWAEEYERDHESQIEHCRSMRELSTATEDRP